MGGRSGRTSRLEPKHPGWLKRLDDLASSLPRSRWWIDYHAFTLVRHPQLRPQNDPYESEFDELIQQWRIKLIRHGVLKRIPSVQRQREIAALVLDGVDRYERWKPTRRSLSRMKTMSQHGPGKIRKVSTKIARAQKLLQEVKSDLAKADLFVQIEVLQAIDRALDALTLAKFPARDETVESYTTRMATWYEESRRESAEPIDPRPDQAQMLTSYLQSVCGFPAPRSHVVTMRIGNAFWEWDYRASKNDYGVEDCPALRMLFARRRTPPKKRR